MADPAAARDPSADSLRERSKAKRRAAIQRAALELFAARGYDQTSISDIADAAELARRTVTVYFPNKIDIAMSSSNDIADRLTRVFRAHPQLSFSEAIGQWLAGEAHAAEPDLAALTVAMLQANPTLRAVSTSPILAAASAARPALIAELGLPADHPMVRLVTAALGAAISEHVTAFTLDPGGHPAPVEPDEFLRFIRAIMNAAQPQ